jgi:threonine dehydratase
VTEDDVRAAHRRMRGVLVPTPLVRSEARDAWLKLESLQPTGAFKVRGAFNAVARAVERGDRRGVVAASAGNHARGLAWAARHFGIDATVVMPESAPRTKIDGCRALGAHVVVCGATLDEAMAVARGLPGRFVHPYDDEDVIAGQGTLALELPATTDVVVAPVGGGGLAAGLSLVRRVRVVGVVVEGVDAMARALRGEPERPPVATIADGLRVRAAGRLAVRLLAERGVEIVTVTETAVRRALADIAAGDRIIAEGAGAVAVAALPQVAGRRRVAVVSGGNIDAERFATVLAESRP